jgi:pantetheine-phosphate adenylyltransferase
MEKIALFPGSFDPFTIGHESVVLRALPLFDKIIVAVGYNSAKSGFFPLEKRIHWIEEIFKSEKKIEVQSYEDLTANFCKKVGARYILRGLRTAADFEYERAIAQMNKMLDYDIETVFLLTKPEHSPISSTIVREVIRYGGDASQFVPKEVNLKD